MGWEDDLGDVVGRLHRSAIDARMCGKRGFLDDGRLSEYAWNRESYCYYIGELGSIAQFLRCTRPDDHRTKVFERTVRVELPVKAGG
ncbi:MAG: hypothetical protein FWH11_11525 [Micrococcales bacterium]|nr:hypothetical protein [Micrococcales bacterium]